MKILGRDKPLNWMLLTCKGDRIVQQCNKSWPRLGSIEWEGAWVTPSLTIIQKNNSSSLPNMEMSIVLSRLLQSSKSRVSSLRLFKESLSSARSRPILDMTSLLSSNVTIAQGETLTAGPGWPQAGEEVRGDLADPDTRRDQFTSIWTQDITLLTKVCKNYNCTSNLNDKFP